MFRFFDQVSLQTRILSVGLGLPTLIIATLVFLYSQEQTDHSVQASLDKARSLCATAESARDHCEQQWEDEIFNAQQLKNLGDSGEQEKLLSTVPIVTAWNVTMEKSEEGGYELRVPALNPRNPANTPNELQARALQRLKAESLTEYFEVNQETNTVHYFRPVVLSESCLICHGLPDTSEELWATTDGTDITGFPMEGWEVGEMHGAFEIVQSLEPAAEQAAASVWWAIALSGFAIALSLAATLLILKSVRVRVARTSSAIDESLSGLTEFRQQLSSDSDQTMERSQAMAGSVAETTENISNLYVAMQQMQEASGEIAMRSTEAVEVANDAVVKVGNASSTIAQLDSETDRIHSVIELINSLAEQTNLLALNATIEAARAGEFGKGFAVVANEVKELANQTGHATRQIADVIGAIQSGTASSLESIQTISGIIHEICDAQTAIASAVEQQNATTREVTSSLQDVSNNSQAITDQIKAVSRCTQQTNDRVLRSQDLMIAISEASDEVPRMIGIDSHSELEARGDLVA